MPIKHHERGHMYQLFSDFFTLLDQGVLFWLTAHLAGASLLLHLLVKLAPPRIRVAAALLAILAFLLLARASVCQATARGYAALGMYYDMVRDVGKAFPLHTQAWRWGNRTPQTAARLIRGHAATGDWDAAFRLASETLPELGSNPHLLTAAGELYLNGGRPETAASIARRLTAAEDMTDWIKGYDLLVKSHVRRGDPAGAMKVLQEAIDRIPSPEVKEFFAAEMRKWPGFPAAPEEGRPGEGPP